MSRTTEPAQIRRLLAGCLAALAVLLITQPLAHAREVLDPTDPAFDDAECFDLGPPALGMPPGALEHEFSPNGVNFGFESTSGTPLDAFGPDGIVVFSFGGPGNGVVVTANPPVPAIGFFGEELDGCPGGNFIGAFDNEEVNLDGQIPCNGFFGAADIGNMGTVNLENFNSVFLVTELCYVPPSVIPMGDADVSVEKSASETVALNSVPIEFQLEVENAGPDTAEDVQIIDFPPQSTFTDAEPPVIFDPTENVVVWNAGDFGPGIGADYFVDITTPASRTEFSCNSELFNVAAVNSATPDPFLGNNLSTSSVRFDEAAVRGLGSTGEICGNGIDDECDGFFECADSECDCRPTLPPGPGGDQQCWGGIIEGPPGDPPIIIDPMCNPINNDSDNHSCMVPRGRCGGVTVPAYCCDPSTWSDPSLNGSQALQRCNVGVPGCAPVDPNFKESDPTVNIAGYGLTEAGRAMTYTIHYENVGNADALDVEILDSLDPDLDDTTLTINDGGTYDPATRTIRWTDPVVPPTTPRAVSFQIDVRDDATPGTRVRNVGTIIFPNADPPTRIDTDFVEHVIPEFPIEPDLRVRNCEEMPPGSGMWKVYLVNEGSGFAYNVTAEILNPPPGVNVTSGVAAFAHTDDEDPDVLATVIPNATTMSRELIAFDTQTPEDPCGALLWLIRWENLQGDESTREVRSLPDRDNDAVPDDDDNCPDNANSDQADSDDDGIGDVCDSQEPVPCDIDGDGDVDIMDIMLILAARNTPAAGPDDPRDRDGDGWITVLDARMCVVACSLPRCASPPPPP